MLQYILLDFAGKYYSNSLLSETETVKMLKMLKIWKVLCSDDFKCIDNVTKFDFRHDFNIQNYYFYQIQKLFIYGRIKTIILGRYVLKLLCSDF